MASKQDNQAKAPQLDAKPDNGKDLSALQKTLPPNQAKVRIKPSGADSQIPVGVSESGADADDDNDVESGSSVEEVILDEAELAEGSAQGLFGGLGVAAGVDVAATGGLASLGLFAGLTGGAGGDEPIETPPKPSLQVLGVDSEGLNIGPSEDGTGPQGLDLANTQVTLTSGKYTVATVNELTLIDPNAPVPDGSPISVDGATGQLEVNLGPVGQVGVGLTPQALGAAIIPLANSVSSGNIELESIATLDLPTSIAGTDVPITSTLTDVLVQVGDALSPITDSLSGALGSGLPDGGSNPLEGVPLLGDLIDQGPAALAGIPVIGDVMVQLEGSLPVGSTDAFSGGGEPIDNVPLLGPVLEQATDLLGGPSPIGELPVGSGTQIPTTVPELDLVTNQVTSAINSVADGQNPLAPVIAALPI
jgi:hypothetical protein